jgi:hypothetical protein
MARRQNHHFINPVQQEIAHRAIPHTACRGRILRSAGPAMMRVAKFVDGIEEENNYPVIGTEEKLTFGRFGAKATFTVFVRDGFDKDSSRPFDMGIIGEDGFEHFVPNSSADRFYIGETEVFYDPKHRSWSCVDSDPHYYYDDGYVDLYDHGD